MLAALVVYPIGYTTWRSLRDASGRSYLGLHNYVTMFRSDSTRTAIGNNVIWLLVAPTVVTALGTVFAVVTERVRWATAFKLVLFMPMAISFLAAGIIFSLVYADNPDRGLANATVVAVHDVVSPAAAYPGARPRDPGPFTQQADGSLRSSRGYQPGESALVGLVGVRPTSLPAGRVPAVPTAATPGTVGGTVWFDFVPGGGGVPGAIDPGERALPGVVVQAVRDGTVVATARTGDRGEFRFGGLPPATYTLRLPASNFTEPFAGFVWLGPTLVTWSIIGGYVWMWTGFAMVLIAAGLAAIPREALEAARVDGGTEWQVFRRVTVPLLSPVLVVVLVTLMINVLKVFDLVFILAPQSSQDDANVLALEMWRVSFGGGQDQGLGSALGVFLFLLVLPAMIFNVRRFHRGQR
ncbi:MAG: ABC transporter permease subunit [Actinobacteria bacterium]|nr:ABC transporter permease subunit [Actinomycetota bacterium]